MVELAEPSTGTVLAATAIAALAAAAVRVVVLRSGDAFVLVGVFGLALLVVLAVLLVVPALFR